MRFILEPTEIADCALWLDAMDAPSIVQSGGLITQWSDKSGNAKHATEANPANQPLPDATAYGGFPCVNWGNGEAPNRRLATPNISYDQHTVFFALRSDPSSAWVYVHESSSAGNREYLLFGSGNPNINVRRGAGTQSGKNLTALSSTSSSFINDGCRHIVTRVYAGTHVSNRVRVDGVEQQALTYLTLNGNPAAVLSNGPFYLGNPETPGNPFRGLFAEVIVYSRALTESEIMLVERYLARKWRVAPQLLRMIDSPLELPNCAIWLEGSQVTLDGSALVQQWNDTSGNARHWAQSTPAQRPSYVASNPLFAGKPTVRWPLANASVYLDRLAADNFASPVTVITCGLCANADNTNIGYFVNVSGGDFSFQRLNSASYQFFNGAATTMSFSPPPINQPFIATFSSSAPARQSFVRLNRGIVSRGGGTPTTMSTLRLGSMYNPFGSQNWVGDIAEHIIYVGRRIVDNEIVCLENYLNRKYGALPVRSAA